MVTILIADQIIDGKTGAALGRTEILVEGGFIVEMGPMVPRPEGAEVIVLYERHIASRFHPGLSSSPCNQELEERA